METNTAYGAEYCNDPKLRERYEEEGQKIDYKKIQLYWDRAIKTAY